MTNYDLAVCFEYLDELRDSGVTNMYGAGPYLRREFSLNEGESMKVLLSWIDTFDPDANPVQRATEALKNDYPLVVGQLTGGRR